MSTNEPRPDDLYERDFYLWTQAQAEALRAEAQRRAGGSNAVDWARVAEEIEDMGARDLRECLSRVAVILEHLFKLAWSHRSEPRGGWRATIRIQRRELLEVMTATLRPKTAAALERLHASAAEAASDAFDTDETGVPKDLSLRWTFEQILGEADDPLA